MPMPAFHGPTLIFELKMPWSDICIWTRDIRHANRTSAAPDGPLRHPSIHPSISSLHSGLLSYLLLTNPSPHPCQNDDAIPAPSDAPRWDQMNNVAESEMGCFAFGYFIFICVLGALSASIFCTLCTAHHIPGNSRYSSVQRSEGGRGRSGRRESSKSWIFKCVSLISWLWWC